MLHCVFPEGITLQIFHANDCRAFYIHAIGIINPLTTYGHSMCIANNSILSKANKLSCFITTTLKVPGNTFYFGIRIKFH